MSARRYVIYLCNNGFCNLEGKELIQLVIFHMTSRKLNDFICVSKTKANLA